MLNSTSVPLFRYTFPDRLNFEIGISSSAFEVSEKSVLQCENSCSPSNGTIPFVSSAMLTVSSPSATSNLMIFDVSPSMVPSKDIPLHCKTNEYFPSSLIVAALTQMIPEMLNTATSSIIRAPFSLTPVFLFTF